MGHSGLRFPTSIRLLPLVFLRIALEHTANIKALIAPGQEGRRGLLLTAANDAAAPPATVIVSPLLLGRRL